MAKTSLEQKVEILSIDNDEERETKNTTAWRTVLDSEKIGIGSQNYALTPMASEIQFPQEQIQGQSYRKKFDVYVINLKGPADYKSIIDDVILDWLESDRAPGFVIIGESDEIRGVKNTITGLLPNATIASIVSMNGYARRVVSNAREVEDQRARQTEQDTVPILDVVKKVYAAKNSYVAARKTPVPDQPVGAGTSS